MNRLKTNFVAENTAQWRSLDKNREPVTDEHVSGFMEYITGNPILQDYESDHRAANFKIRAAINLYKNIDNKELRDAIIEVLMKTFERIQAERDTLGINRNSKTEGHLYVRPDIILKDPEGSQGMMLGPRIHDVLIKEARRINNIESLEQIHGALYDSLVEIKVQPCGITPRLERSPAEKARTKDALEAQAAAAREKLEPKIQEAEESR